MAHFKFITTAALTGILSSTTAPNAHGVWFAQRAEQLALIYGVGANDLKAAKRVPQVPSRAMMPNGKIEANSATLLRR
jgi:hypothetical protein